MLHRLRCNSCLVSCSRGRRSTAIPCKASDLYAQYPPLPWHGGCDYASLAPKGCREERAMRGLAIVSAVLLVIGSLGAGLVMADDTNVEQGTQADSKVKQGTDQVQSGAKEIGQGVKDTAKGVGKTVTGGAERAGEKVKEAKDAAEPKARNAWENVRDGAKNFGQGVKSFFTTLFNK